MSKMRQLSPPRSPRDLIGRVTHEPIYSKDSKKQQVNVLHYSICQKEAATCMFMANKRMLILNENQGTLYYINQIDSYPFKTVDKIPRPKNKYTYVKLCVAKRENQESSTLLIQFNDKDNGGKIECVEWKFAMESRKLAKDWEALIKNIKLEKVAKALGIDPKDKQVVGAITDTLSFGLLGNMDKNKAIKNGEDQEESQQKKDMTNYFMTLGKKPVQNNAKNQSEIKKTAPQQQSLVDQNIRVSSGSSPNLSERYKISKTIVEQPSEQNDLTSRTKEKEKKTGEETDWNLQFLEKHNQVTIKLFQREALQQFQQVFKQKLNFGTKQQSQKPIIINKGSIHLFLAQSKSVVAEYLREEFQNYNYIVESCEGNGHIGVPLTCLIQYKGVIALVKASFPEGAKLVQNQENHSFSTTLNAIFKQFQKQTKIKTDILRTCSVVLNLSSDYGLHQTGLPRFYLDQIAQFVPYHPKVTFKSEDRKFSTNQIVCPSLILDNFSRVINSAELQSQQELDYYLNQSLKKLSEYLISQQKILSSFSDLQDIMDHYGLKISALPNLYYIIDIRCKKQNAKHLRKLVMTSMTALLIKKTEIDSTLQQFVQFPEKAEQAVQGIIRRYCEGGSSINQESWKKLTLEFKKAYEMPMISHQIQPGLFLSCLMEISNAEFDLTKLNKNKKIFKQKEIIGPKFVKKILPKIHSYNNYLSQQTQQIMTLCENLNLNNINKIKACRQSLLEHSKHREQTLLGKNKKKFLAYLSCHLNPFECEYTTLISQIFKPVNQQPVTEISHIITLSYLKFSLDRLLSEQDSQTAQMSYKSCIQKAATNTKYWLGEEHPYICDILDELSQFYNYSESNYDEACRYLKDSLIISKKTCGPKNQQTAQRYHKLGDLQLKNGYKREAGDNLYTAKDILQSNIDEQPTQYAIILNKIARLQLANGNIDTSLAEAEKSILLLEKVSQNYHAKNSPSHFLTYSNFNKIIIDNYLILSKGFQIQGNAEKLRKLSNELGKLLNKQSSPLVFDSMVRMCMIGNLYVIPHQKIQKLKQFIKYNRLCAEQEQKIQSSKLSQAKNVHSCRIKLMRQVQQIQVAEKLTSKIDQIDRIVDQILKNCKEVKPETQQVKQFREIWSNFVVVLGGDEILQSIIQKIQEK